MYGRKECHSVFESSAELIRSTLMPSTKRILGRGECQTTDSLVDETINSLANDLKLCLDTKKEHTAKLERQITESTRQQQIDYDKTNPIATKFFKWQTDVLTNWMVEHREKPYPTHAQICELANTCNLLETQVVNWATNVRKRNLRGTVVLGKKAP